jgi:putative transposase
VDRGVARLPSIPKELVSLFLTGPMTGEAINEAGIAFKKALIEASLNAELGHHLGYGPGSDKPDQVTNHRNGSTAKTVLTGDGKVLIETPRDREGGFEPLLLPKHARRLTAFDDSIVALYARGLTVREIQGVPTWHRRGIARRPGQIHRVRRDRSHAQPPVSGRAWRGPTI